jgi:phosphinothricin acetyltransferase
MRTIRLADPHRDATGCHEIYRPIVEGTVTSFEIHPPEAAEFARRMESMLLAFPWLVCEEGAAILGYAYASAHRGRPAYQWCAEVSVYVRDGSRGAGIGADLYRALFECLQLQGYVNLYAGIAQPNPTSVAFHEAMGFEPVGVYRRIGYKFGRWHDVGWWGLRLPEPARPRPPRALAACRPEVEALLARRATD